MENEASSRRGRLMGKLFGSKDRKVSESANATSLDAFLHSSDNLQVTHPPPPPPPTTLPKLDTTISRYPQAAAVNQQAQFNRPVAAGYLDLSATNATRAPRPNKKGLLIRFSEARPEVIGQGGDECDIPTMEISRAKLARSPQPPPPPPAAVPPQRVPVPPTADIFRPKRLARTQTGYSSIYSPETGPENNGDSEYPNKWRESPPLPGTQPKLDVPSKPAAGGLLATPTHDENRKSFIEMQKAQMRKAEGQAFAKAARNSSVAYDGNWEDPASPATAPPTTIAESPQSYAPKKSLDYSPATSLTSMASSTYPPSLPSPVQATAQPGFPPPNEDIRPMAARMASVRLNDTMGGDGVEALDTFVRRTTHLHELFRLHAETVVPLQSCELKDLGRAGLWWFLKGRLGLEQAIREKQPNAQATPKAQMQIDLDKQQAYANLSKAYWLCQHAIPETSQARRLPPDSEILAATEQLMSSLKKLAMSMKRNAILPPEEPFLPATIDKAVWLEYPAMSQDMIALLSGDWGSGISAIHKPTANLQILNALPLGDSADFFSYGRVAADCFLMEQGREAQRFYFSCFLSILRPQTETGLVFIIASQNGVVELAIQDKKGGPVWEDLRWRNDTCTLELRLPRGFLLAVQLAQTDYRMLWNMYDFGARVRSTLKPRPDETVVFRNTLPSFQYIDSDPQSRVFPKDAVVQCEVALFERVYKENGPAGQRNWHSGFRIAAVTGPKTRTLNGVQHNYPTLLPVQFGFFRDGEAPALSIKFEGNRQKGRMVLTFSDEKERVRFHSLITGTALEVDERIFANVPLRSLQISEKMSDTTGILPFGRMPWKAAQVTNDEFGPNGEQPMTVLSDKLKVVLEYQNGMVTDRINVAPGEMRLRLDVSNKLILRMLRQPQQDMTVSISEAQVPKELAAEMTRGLQLIRQKPTIRTMEFNSLRELHEFQYAVTGYEVVFDAMATTFAIARRRMVVPIHKKWEAGLTRIQVVRQEDKQVQMLAFFENWHHGHCMNFVLKGTDVYESFQRSGKAGIKFVDAKFPLPRVPEDKDGDIDDMAFVCLDLPDLPGEHDDISILFETELDRDRLCEFLPATVKEGGRLSISRLR
ncbi:hypothetical protein ISF_03705 [Cordyceps fumosorosea ARSEF 2679]|uniref:Uncharacterized protein n=1 Tax=Cordyceps fumosorosea (strain ARSEF 2679) TaxID=1081104 RepID=A0A167ZHM8_CORFA|nr:hypothetical protein ISF_03705 [Cordyceps fumosorosea ARSEF 2679]OAA67529.1 hypothetical protein ISF_03705 [Cordyceps fumosorosea ARSEF 2679]